ncbi:MAG: VWA domain-containing protein [Phycisphaerales bacterium]
MPAVTAPTLNTPEGAPEGNPIWLRARRWVYRGSLLGVAISIWVHLVLWIIAALVHVPYSNADAGGGAGESVVEFAIMNDIDLAPPAEADASEPVPASAEAAPAEIADLSELVAGDTDPLTDQAIDTRSMTDLSSGSGDGLASDLSGFGAAGGAGASFFGLEAQGRRFVYIIDVSGSMSDEIASDQSQVTGDDEFRLRRFDYTRNEVIRSISSLLETSEFSVIFYADYAHRLFKNRWIPATERNKIMARTLLERADIRAIPNSVYSDFTTDLGSSTRPGPAFSLAFNQGSRPDAIYFMTDGEFPPKIVADVANLNQHARIPIHCILFTDPGSPIQSKSEELMKEIARQSGGRYTLVDGSRP